LPQKIVSLISETLSPSLLIPPPYTLAELPLKVAFVKVGTAELMLAIPPPLAAELPLKVTFVNIEVLPLLHIPPP
jgi:hypothetical protein